MDVIHFRAFKSWNVIPYDQTKNSDTPATDHSKTQAMIVQYHGRLKFFFFFFPVFPLSAVCSSLSDWTVISVSRPPFAGRAGSRGFVRSRVAVTGVTARVLSGRPPPGAAVCDSGVRIRGRLGWLWLGAKAPLSLLAPRLLRSIACCNADTRFRRGLDFRNMVTMSKLTGNTIRLETTPM